MFRKIRDLALVLGAYALLAWLSTVAFSQDPLADLQKKLENLPPTPGRITVEPAEAEPYEPIVATLETVIPDGAEVFGDGWTCGEGIATIPISSVVQHVWAKPGEHTIAYRGFWYKKKAKEVIVDIVDGKPIKETIEVFDGAGYIDCSASFKVAGGPPVPPPDTKPANPFSKPSPAWLQDLTALRRAIETTKLPFQKAKVAAEKLATIAHQLRTDTLPKSQANLLPLPPSPNAPRDKAAQLWETIRSSGDTVSLGAGPAKALGEFMELQCPHDKALDVDRAAKALDALAWGLWEYSIWEGGDQ